MMVVSVTTNLIGGVASAVWWSIDDQSALLLSVNFYVTISGFDRQK